MSLKNCFKKDRTKMPMRNDIYSAELLFFQTFLKFLFNLGHHNPWKNKFHVVDNSESYSVVIASYGLVFLN